jgi:hypothetical protein
MHIRQGLRLRLFGSVVLLTLSAIFGLFAGLSHPAARPSAAAAHLAIVAAGLLGVMIANHTYTLLTQTITRAVVALRELGHGRPARVGTADLPEDLRALAQAANATSGALAARQHELHDQLRRTALLTRLAIDLRASFDQAAIASDILAAISLHTDACDASIMLAGSDGAIELALTTAGGQPRPLSPEQARRELRHGPAGHVWRTGDVLLANNAPAAGWDRGAADRPVGSVVALPLAHGGATFGALTINHPLPGQFSSRSRSRPASSRSWSS